MKKDKEGDEMGRKIKLDGLKGHYSNEELAKRDEAKKELFTQSELEETPPDWLSTGARTEWGRIIPLLKGNVPVSNLDYSLIATYCSLYATIQTCQRDIKKHGLVVKSFNSAGKEVKTANPYVKIQSQAIKDMRAIATSLCLTLDSRQRLAMDKSTDEKPKDPFMELISNG